MQNHTASLGLPRKTRLTAWGLVAALALPLTALATQTINSPALLRYKLKEGDTTQYQMTMHMTTTIKNPSLAQPMTIPGDVTTVVEQKVTKAFPQGGGEIVTTTISQEGRVNNQPMPAQTIPPITTTYDARGKILSLKGLPANNPMTQAMGGGIGSSGMMGMSAALPEKPVKPGDTWTQTVSLPGYSASGTAKCTLVRFEKVGPYQTARIRTLMTMPMSIMIDATQQPTKDPSKAVVQSSGTVTTSSDTNFVVGAGKIIRTAATVTAAMNIQPKGALAAKSKAKGAKPAAMAAMTMTMKMTMAMNMVQK